MHNSILKFLPAIFLLGCMETVINPIQKDPDVGDPEIEVAPDEIDFGIVPAGERSLGTVVVSSVGSVTLDISSMSIVDSSSTFTLTNTMNGRYSPGDSFELIVSYDSDGEAHTGTLSIASNDPSDPETSVSLIARVEGEDTDDTDTGTPLSSPVAVCAVDPVEVLAIYDDATWVGSASYDPDGGTIVSYDWSLSSIPAGSTSTMPAGTMNRRNFIPDVAGEYVGQLVVTDDSGNVSEPCFATLTATAGGGLWVEMFWTHSGDDMDLHLLDDGGSLTTTSDCYYGNCTWGGLDWGVRGNTADDPSLDLDDIPGTGPENINIDVPARGVYTVYVHDYPGSVYNGRNDVTVNVYLGGSLAWTDTRNINSEGCYEPFVEIDVSRGTTTDLLGGCR